jgi:replicative DNA helicase
MSEAERMAIGAILYRNTLYDDLGLLPSDFQDVDNRRMYQAMAALIESGMTVDIKTLYATGKLPASTIVKYEDVPISNGKFYARALKEATKQRQLTTLTKQVADMQRTKVESNEIIQAVESELYKIQERKDNEVKHIKSYLHGAMDEIEAAYNNGGRIIGVLSGFTDLDNTLSGFQNGDLVIIAARTSIGKTAFALNIAEYASMHNNKALFFSCEMSANQICKRVLSSLGKIDHKRLINGNLESEGNFNALTAAADKMYESHLYCDFTPLIPFAELKAKARIAKRNGCDIIFIDYLTLIKYGDNKTPRWERTGELIKELKTMARQLDIPVIALSQLNRQAEGQTPSLAELRQSGEIEEHSDVIIFLHRDRGATDTELIIAKHRNGATGKFALWFDEARVRFETGVNR